MGKNKVIFSMSVIILLLIFLAINMLTKTEQVEAQPMKCMTYELVACQGLGCEVGMTCPSGPTFKLIDFTFSGSINDSLNNSAKRVVGLCMGPF